jgi:hypothetical protein
MFLQYDTDGNETQTAEEESQLWAQQLETYLRPYSQRLDAYLDRRVVGNLTATIASIVQTRSELTLAQLGSAICGPEHSEAGTQRLQRALHHQGWTAEVIEELLWDQAEQSRKQMEQRGETPLCIWDSSVLEKPESVALEGLGAVRSSRVRRLARSRPDVFNRPGLPVRVRGLEWESLLLVGKSAVRKAGGDALVDTRKAGQWATKATAGGPVRSGGTTMGTAGAPRRRIAAMGTVPGSGASRRVDYALWCGGKKAISCWMPRGRNAKPGKSPVVNDPGERRACGGTPISASIAAPGCSPCPCPTRSMTVSYGWS